MPITSLDPHTALVVIDLQKGILKLPMAHPTTPVVANAALLAAAFRTHQLSVVLVNVGGSAPGRTDQGVRAFDPSPEFLELLPELDQQPSDLVLTKRRWGAFSEPSLDVELRKRGVTQLVLAGIATSIGVELTARRAYELGYNVTLAVDAMTDAKIEAHVNSITRIFPRLGETGTTQAIIEALERSRS